MPGTTVLSHYGSGDGKGFAMCLAVTDDAGKLTYYYAGDDAQAVFGAEIVAFGEHDTCGEEGALTWIGEVAWNRGLHILLNGKSAPQPGNGLDPGQPVENARLAEPGEEVDAPEGEAEPEPTVFQAILVIGKTYEYRRLLAGNGCIFQRDEGGYVCPIDKREVVAGIVASAGKDLSMSDIETDRDPSKPLDYEEKRARRADKALRKADRLDSQAANRERDSRAARAKHRPYTSDYSFITQPILVGHHSERRHRRLWDRIDSARDAEMRNAIEADKLKGHAERLRDFATNMPRKGDAERRYEARRQAAVESGIKVGSWVACSVYGEGRVHRENAKTYGVFFTAPHIQRVLNIDKGWAKLLRQDDSPMPAAKFKKGDEVMVVLHYSGKGEGKPGVVQRKTPRGYSVLIEGYSEARTVAEDRLSERVREDVAA